MKRFSIMKWKQAVDEINSEMLKRNKLSIILNLRKYFNLYPDSENRADLNTLNID